MIYKRSFNVLKLQNLRLYLIKLTLENDQLSYQNSCQNFCLNLSKKHIKPFGILFYGYIYVDM